jgi:hypothetical protein
MRTILTIGAAALILCACVGPRHETVAAGVSAGGPVYDGWYDGYYGPYTDGYWGDDGFFYYSSGGTFVRDNDRHFRRDTAPGFAHVQAHPAPAHPMPVPPDVKH